MNVRPMLGEWEVPRLAAIQALEERVFAELPVPGRTGSLFHDLNTAPTRLLLRGSLYGDEARSEFLSTVREHFQAGEPISFVADIVTATEVRFVLIESLYVEESAERPDELEYEIAIRESPPPPPPADPLGALDLELLDQATSFLDSVTGALDVIGSLESIPDIGDPTPPLRSALEGVTAAAEGLDAVVTTLHTLLGSDS